MEFAPELSSEEEALYNMSDEELDAAFAEAKASLGDDPIEEVVEEEAVVEDEVITEEVIEDTTEQSDEIDSADVEVNDEITDEVAEEPSTELDEEVVEKAEEVKETVPELPSKYKVKADGNEFEFTPEELVQLAPKAMNYTKKMQEIAPWRKTISALEENDVNHDDVNLMIEALKGNKDAITSLVKKSGIDSLELDLDAEQASTYTPQEHGLSERDLAIRDIERSISKDQEYGITTHVVNNQWDDASRQAMQSNPTMIEGLHSDIKTGVFDKVNPIAMKMRMLDGGNKSDVEYYMEAGKQYYAEQANAKNLESERLTQEKIAQEKLLNDQKEIEEVKARQAKQREVQTKSSNRKAAAPTSKSAGKKSVTNYLDEDNDEAYEEWYKNTMDNI